MYSHTKSTWYRCQLAREVLHSTHPQFVTCSVKQWPVAEHIRTTNEAYPLHRCNNRRDWGRLFPQLLGWGPTMYWSPNFLAIVFKKQEISQQVLLLQPTNKHSSHQNAGFSIWVFKNFPGVIPSDPHSGKGRPPPAPNTQPGPVLGPKPWPSSTFQPWLCPWSFDTVMRTIWHQCGVSPVLTSSTKRILCSLF